MEGEIPTVVNNLHYDDVQHDSKDAAVIEQTGPFVADNHLLFRRIRAQAVHVNAESTHQTALCSPDAQADELGRRRRSQALVLSILVSRRPHPPAPMAAEPRTIEMERVRSMLKSFERSYKAAHGTNPTKEVLTPEMSALYRRHKELKKAMEGAVENLFPQTLPAATGASAGTAMPIGPVAQRDISLQQLPPQPMWAQREQQAQTVENRPTDSEALRRTPAQKWPQKWPGGNPMPKRRPSFLGGFRPLNTLPKPEPKAENGPETVAPDAHEPPVLTSSPGQQAAPERAATSRSDAAAAEAIELRPEWTCCQATGCICLEPGLRCGFHWQRNSAYENARDARKLENEAMLRSLGLLPAEASPTDQAAMNQARACSSQAPEAAAGSSSSADRGTPPGRCQPAGSPAFIGHMAFSRLAAGTSQPPAAATIPAPAAAAHPAPAKPSIASGAHPARGAGGKAPSGKGADHSAKPRKRAAKAGTSSVDASCGRRARAPASSEGAVKKGGRSSAGIAGEGGSTNTARAEMQSVTRQEDEQRDGPLAVGASGGCRPAPSRMQPERQSRAKAVAALRMETDDEGDRSSDDGCCEAGEFSDGESRSGESDKNDEAGSGEHWDGAGKHSRPASPKRRKAPKPPPPAGTSQGAAAGAAEASSTTSAPAAGPASASFRAQGARGRGGGRGRGGKASDTGNYVKISKSGTYAGRGGCRGKLGTSSGALRLRADRQRRKNLWRMKSGAGEDEMVPPPQMLLREDELRAEMLAGGQCADAGAASAAVDAGGAPGDTAGDPTPRVAGRFKPRAAQAAAARAAAAAASLEAASSAPDSVWDGLADEVRGLLRQAASTWPAAADGSREAEDGLRQPAPEGAVPTSNEVVPTLRGSPPRAPSAREGLDCVISAPAACNEASEPAEGAKSPLLLALLRAGFGLDGFRRGQLHAIERVLSRRSTLLVLPTGAGKSLTYQLPALLGTQITLVVSPLLALIADQVASLPPALRGVLLSSEQQVHERRATYAALRCRDACGAAASRVLFVAPERLADHAFQHMLRTLPPVAGCRCGAAGVAAQLAAAQGGIGCVGSTCTECGSAALPAVGFACVDEAHCLSEWSHNFRPAYMAVGPTLHSLGVQTILALTATATVRTTGSIAANLRIPPDGVLRIDEQRSNLELHAEIVPSAGRLRRLLEILRHELPAGEREVVGGAGAAVGAGATGGVRGLTEGGCAIVYTGTKAEAERIANALRCYGWKAEHYHAGRPASERRRVHTDFSAGQVRVVVATVAFGMGVDKSDVRVVAHVGLPRSIENWVQETGRAGRDGERAVCHALVSEDDYRWLHSRCHSDGVEMDQMLAMLSELLKNAHNGYGELPVAHLEKKLDMGREVVQTALALLAEVPDAAWRADAVGTDDNDGRGAIDGDALHAGGFAAASEPSDSADSAAGDAFTCTHAVRPERPLLESLPEIRRTATLRFHGEPPDVVCQKSPLVAMMLKTARVSNGSYRCRLVQAASELNMDAHEAHEILLSLQAASILRFVLEEVALYVRVRHSPTAAELRALAVLLCERMHKIDELQLAKLDASASLLWSLASGQPIGPKLAAYFGPDSAEVSTWPLPLSLSTPVGGDGRLRGDLINLVSAQLAAAPKPGKMQAKLSGRTIARIMHGLSSPAFTWKEHHRSQYWGMHSAVAFDKIKRMADEVLETARRRQRQDQLLAAARERTRNKRKEPDE